MASTDAPVDPQTLDFIFSQAKDVPESQMRTAEAIDAKVVQIFAAGTVVIGLAAAGGIRGHASVGWLIAAAAAYLVALTGTLVALQSRSWRTNASPTTLWNDHWQDDLDELKWALVEDLADGYKENDDKLRAKMRAFKVVLSATGLESMLVAVALIISLA